MGSRQKGNLRVRQCKKYLEEEGWLVGHVERKGKFVKEKDLFGLGDLFAVNKRNLWMIIQVTSSRPHTLGAYKEFAKKYCDSSHLLRQYVWIKKKGFRIYCFYDDGSYKKFNLYPDKKVKK